MPGTALELMPGAERDLEDIWFSIAIDNPRAADRLVELIRERAGQLATFPMSGRIRPEISADARSLVVGNYVIMYRVAPTAVEIVRILHGARDATDLF